MKKASRINFKKYQFYFLGLIILLMILLTYHIIKPFLIIIITSIILSYVFYPIYLKVLKYIPNRNIAAFTVTFLMVILLILPPLLMINSITKETYTSYIVLKQRLFSGNLFGVDCTGKNNSICKISNYVKNVVNEQQLRYYIDTAQKKATSYLIEVVSDFFFSLPVKIINFFIMVFTFFYFLRDSEIFTSWLKRLLPLEKLHQKHIFKKFNEVTYGVIYGQLLIAIIQGILGGIGFWIFGISSPIFWGSAMAFLALIPYLGPPVIWVPAALLKIIEGTSTDNNALAIKGILLFLYGLIMVSGLDNLLRPKLIGDRANVHPIIVLLGVIGGLKIFGIVGLVIGPVILSIMITLFKIYEKETAK